MGPLGRVPRDPHLVSGVVTRPVADLAPQVYVTRVAVTAVDPLAAGGPGQPELRVRGDYLLRREHTSGAVAHRGYLGCRGPPSSWIPLLASDSSASTARCVIEAPWNTFGLPGQP